MADREWLIAQLDTDDVYQWQERTRGATRAQYEAVWTIYTALAGAREHPKEILELAIAIVMIDRKYLGRGILLDA